MHTASIERFDEHRGVGARGEVWRGVHSRGAHSRVECFDARTSPSVAMGARSEEAQSVAPHGSKRWLNGSEEVVKR